MGLLLGSWLLAATFVLAALASTASARPPNVIVVLVDDLGWADWERNGAVDGSRYYETPHMNRLAAEGVSFDHAYASAAVCSPSRAALLTGSSPARSRLTQWIPGATYDSRLSEPGWIGHLTPQRITLAEALREEGYRSASIGKWHLGTLASPGGDPLDHGFDENVGGGWPGTPPRWFADDQGGFVLPGLWRGSSEPGSYLTDRLTDAAVEWIDENADAPFFLYLSHYGVHVPIAAPEALTDYFATKEPVGGHSNPVYAAMIASVDDSLGRVLDALEHNGIREETIVVLTSDNGGGSATSNAPLRSGKGTFYEGGIRVPLIVSYPAGDLPAGGSNALVVGHDIFPTVLDLIGLPISSALDGVTFRSALEGGEPLRSFAFFHYPHVSPQSQFDLGGRFVSVLRSARWKLLYHYEARSWQLFDLQDDPGERFDAAQSRRDVSSMLGRYLVAGLVATNAQLPIDSEAPWSSTMPTPLPEASAACLAGAAVAFLAALRRSRTRLF